MITVVIIKWGDSTCLFAFSTHTHMAEPHITIDTKKYHREIGNNFMNDWIVFISEKNCLVVGLTGKCFYFHVIHWKAQGKKGIIFVVLVRGWGSQQGVCSLIAL